MTYIQALGKAWNEILNLAEDKKNSVKFLNDIYDIDLENKSILSQSCNIPPKEHVIILILHYLIQKLKLRILPKPTGEWISFSQLEGGEGYYPAFKKRATEVILRKYGSRPEALLDLIGRFCAKRGQIGDISVVIEAFEGVPILITMWRGNEEFGPEANIHFDASISRILGTEDIVILTEFIVHSL